MDEKRNKPESMQRQIKALLIVFYLFAFYFAFWYTKDKEDENGELYKAAMFAIEEIQAISQDPQNPTMVPRTMSFAAEPTISVDPKLEYGIVACAGNFRALEMLSGLLWVRDLEKVNGMKPLPIEWYYVGDEEMDPPLREYVSKRLENLRFIDCQEYYENYKLLRGFQIKSFALSSTRFRNAVFLDSDCIPVEHPMKLFLSKEYREKGNFFWPDFSQNWGVMRENVLRESSTFRRVLDALSPKTDKNKKDMQILLDTPEAESGQIFIDTLRFKEALRIAWMLNEQSQIFYKFTYGDKNLFMVAFYLAGDISVYNQVKNEPFSFRNIHGNHEAIGQRNPLDASRVAFVHRTHQKHNCLSETPTCVLDAEKGYKEMRFGYPVPEDQSFPVAENVMVALRFVQVQEQELLYLPVFQETLKQKKSI